MQGHNFNQRPPPHSFNQRPPPHSLNQRPPPHNLNQRPPPHNLNQRPPHGLSNHNQHRNPHFYYHPPARHNGGPNTHVRTTTESSHTQKGSIPTVELPKGLSKYRSQYKKWWKVFHADLTNCGTQAGVSSLFRVIGGRISSIKSWPWMVLCFYIFVSFIMQMKCHFSTTLNPLYNDIRYNNKIRYNVNSVYTKIEGSCIFSITVPYYSLGPLNIRLGYLLESPRRGDSNKYIKRMNYEKMFKRIRYSCFRWVHIKFLYNSKFDFTAKSLVTNTVVITRVLCISTILCVLYPF